MHEITIAPIRNFTRTLVCVPDKSITHRALLFNAVAEGTATVSGVLLGQDCLSTLECVRRLGAEIERNGDCVRITGVKRLRSADLDCGNSGTTMRLMSGLLAGYEGEWTLTGDSSLCSRPMRRVIEPLTQMGGAVRSQDGKAPLTVCGRKLHGIEYRMPVASAQVKSAVLLAALRAEGTTRVIECERTRDHTEILLRHMGVDLTQNDKEIALCGGQTLRAASVNVAGDISSAAFPLVGGLIAGGTVTVKNVGINPTRTGILEVFDQIGAEYVLSDLCERGGEKTATVTVRGLGHARPFCIDEEMMPRLVDEIPVLAVLGCYLNGESEISGAEELRVKESDRIAATLRLLRAFGGQAEETESGMRIRGVGRLRGGAVYDPEGDHRMAMSAAIAAMASDKGGTILDPACASVSYPDFWKLFA